MEVAVELGPKRRGPRGDKKPHNKQRRHTRDRQLRWLALALHIEELVLSDQVKNYAEIGRMCGVSRARVSAAIGGARKDECYAAQFALS